MLIRIQIAKIVHEMCASQNASMQDEIDLYTLIVESKEDV